MEFAPGRRTGDGPVGVRTRTGSPRCFPPPVCLSAPSSSSSSAGPSLSHLLPLVLSCPCSAASGLAASHCCGPGQEGPLRSRGWGAAPRPLALLRGLSALGTVTAQAGRPGCLVVLRVGLRAEFRWGLARAGRSRVIPPEEPCERWPCPDGRSCRWRVTQNPSVTM